jgi:Protein of unknown function (DUF1553)/Protein of unknown function (DUF1549)/Planctomycete cytochrome C
MVRWLYVLCTSLASFWCWGVSTSIAADASLSAGEKLFEAEIRPLFVERCYKCHGEKSQKGDLRLDSLTALMQGGESGAALVPGKPSESLLIDAIQHNGLEMPPDGKLKPEQVASVVRWVELGAPWPGSSAEAAPAKKGLRTITAEDRKWWSFQPLKMPALPDVKQKSWLRNDVDRFILAKLESHPLQPNAEAEKRSLIRRLTFDLTGLLPSPSEVEAFENDSDPQAYEKLVERLLESPRYGERWARHWLDVVRYAESDGYRLDDYRPQAWRYRDYVIAAFQNDKPYNRFIQEQLAGDELADADAEALVATGFLTMGIYEYNQRDVRSQWDSIVNEITDVTADVFLAQGLACARCHDHKFDPLLQKDYFRLRAYFAAFSPRSDVPAANRAELAEYAEKLAAWEAKTAEIRAEIASLELPARKSTEASALKKFPPDVQPIFEKPAAERTAFECQIYDLAYRQAQLELDKLDFAKKLKDEKLQQWQDLQAKLKTFDAEKPKPLPAALSARDISSAAPATLIPGKKQAEPIEPGPMSVLDEKPAIIPEPDANAVTTGRRTALARWITDPQNPLTARVMVNRIWQHHFGKGLVSTSSDFGHLGEQPSHAELLDYLALKFMESGWSVKAMHRLIVHSATYRQSSHMEANHPAITLDPQNRWLWRQNARRLDAEQIRDTLLVLGGEIKFQTGGASVETSQPRRTIYTKVYRNKRDPLLEVFDAPENIASTPDRNATTTPLQSLLLINSPWMIARANAFTARVQKEGKSLEGSIRLAYEYAIGKAPNDLQLSQAVSFVKSQAEIMPDAKSAETKALQDFCHVLLNSSSFLYVE